jgi:hypothetical protein
MSLVWDKFTGAGSALLGMLALADWSDDGGRCFPAVSTIARRMRLSRSQAQRVIHQLIDDGFLVVTANSLGGSPTQTRHYRIILSRLTGSTDATGSAHATGSVHAQEGSHPCADRGSAGATQTVSEPSLTTSDNSQANLAGLAAQISKSAKSLNCPVEKIVDAYHRLMPDNPRCKILNAPRRAAIKSRWLEASKLTCKPFGYATIQDGIAAWEQFFATCANSQFLTGKATPQAGKAPFFANVDFLMAPSSFAKILENFYHRTENESKPLWHLSAQGIAAKAIELRLTQGKDELLPDFTRRIFNAAGIDPKRRTA